jgi:undecaprenyl-phosphate 4-deoxy-4-formamido-L-arabinose transferase
MVAILIVGGATLLSLGIIAQYVGAATNMSLGKPLYVVVSDPRDTFET